MIPTNKNHVSEHLLPIVILGLIALASALHAANVGFADRWTSDTTDTFYRIVNTAPQMATTPAKSGLLQTLRQEMGAVLVSQPITQWYQGLFDAYLRSFHLALGDISLAYKLVVFPLVLSYCLGAYFLFLHLTGNRLFALLFAVIAVLPMPLSWAGERSGFGPLWTYTRRYFLTACLPWLVWLYFQGVTRGGKYLIVAMIAVGLASNLHSSGIILAEIFVLAWLLANPLTVMRFAKALGLAVAALLFAVTATGSIWQMGLGQVLQLILSVLSNSAWAAPLDWINESRQSIPEELHYLFYRPKIYTHLPSVLTDIWLLTTCALSLLPLILRAMRKPGQSLALFGGSAACLLFISFEQMWIWVMLGGLLFFAGRNNDTEPWCVYVLSSYLVIATFWVAVGGMLIFQAGHALIDGFPLVFNQLRGIRFMGFWVFVWLAALVKPALPQLRTSQSWRRVILTMLVLITLDSAQTLYRQYFRKLDNDRLELKRALLDIATWAKSNTAPNSRFLVGYSSFGVVSERAVTHADKIVRNQKIDWLPPKGSKPPDALSAIAAEHQASHIIFLAEDIGPRYSRCVLVSNSYYALAETRCIAANSGVSSQSELPVASKHAPP